ncbi:MAG: hypothetical protein HQ522_19670 [Bacteroidetes bacterium]|nr:hypothetical protein [Bacteroidota bacterium]
MKKNKQWIGILTVGLALATGHAIRGQFGHEQGAAWAGAMGGLALVLVANRKDWYQKALLIALALAVGWGAGGMISYGQIAGSYSQSDNFPNVFYGLSMLFIIGGLYGLLGGGLLGLTLDSTKDKPVKWGQFIAEMTVGGLITHLFLIEQIGFRMTPPRGDAWAICLGAGLAMIWYMARNNHLSPLRVVFYSSLGAGFGFAFGTFFHLVMNWIEIPFNTWNMAEYSIGFFGGIGIAYGVFSSKWPAVSVSPKKWENISAMLFVIVLIPLIIFRESFSYGMFLEKYQSLSNTENIAFLNTVSALIITTVLVIASCTILAKSKFYFNRKHILQLFIIYSTTYALLSYIATGFYLGNFIENSNHHLYLVNIVVIALLVRKGYPAFYENSTEKIETNRWITFIFILVLLIAIMAWLSIGLHGETGPSYDRFPMG